MDSIKNVYCLTPVYNDWESCTVLVEHLEQLQFENSARYKFSLVIVNDGSSDEYDSQFIDSNLSITVVNLKINIGHQRAIAAGLQYVYNEIEDYDYVVVMDGDGEDKPEDVLLLLEKSSQTPKGKIIFAERQKRHESLLFKTGYFFYKRLFRYLTGQKISFGNFSVIPKRLLGKVVHQSNIWNHYSGGIIQSKIPYDKILLDRGTRYKGSSKMNFSSLVLHGLSSIAVYFDHISIKILRLSLTGIGICFLTVIYIVGEKLFTNYAIPGWASSLTMIISGIILQLFSVTLIILLLQLSARKNVVAPSSKIYLDFIEDIIKHESLIFIS